MEELAGKDDCLTRLRAHIWETGKRRTKAPLSGRRHERVLLPTTAVARMQSAVLLASPSAGAETQRRVSSASIDIDEAQRNCHVDAQHTPLRGLDAPCRCVHLSKHTTDAPQSRMRTPSSARGPLTPLRLVVECTPP